MSTDRFAEVLGDKRGADRGDTADESEFNPSPLTRARMFVNAINELPEEPDDPLRLLRANADDLKRIAVGYTLLTMHLGHQDASNGGTLDVFAVGPMGVDWQGLVTVGNNGEGEHVDASLWVLDAPPEVD